MIGKRQTDCLLIFGNLYVLDSKQNQILKFVQSGSGFSKTNYFSGTSPDLSKAISMTIDSSIIFCQLTELLPNILKESPIIFLYQELINHL